jgi:hypothetical protein
MAIRLGGIVLFLMGAALAALGAAVALSLLGRPVPDLPGIAALRPILTQMAEAAALPAGSGWDALTGSGSGVAALAGLSGGGLLVLAGLWQAVTGRRSGTVLALVMLMICGFAVAMVFST